MRIPVVVEIKPDYCTVANHIHRVGHLIIFAHDCQTIINILPLDTNIPKFKFPLISIPVGIDKDSVTAGIVSNQDIVNLHVKVSDIAQINLLYQTNDNVLSIKYKNLKTDNVKIAIMRMIDDICEVSCDNKKWVPHETGCWVTDNGTEYRSRNWFYEEMNNYENTSRSESCRF